MNKQVSRIFGYSAETVPLLLNLDFALDTSRNQYHSTLILEKLAGLAPPWAIRVLGIAQVDLFIPILTYVYGEAQLGGKACIISTHRLKEELSPVNTRENYLLRMFKGAFHELGHTFKLRHCPDQNCIMHRARSLRDVDRKSDQFCRYCRVFMEDEKKRLALNYG